MKPRDYYDLLGVRADASADQLARARDRRAALLDPARMVAPSRERAAIAAELCRRLDEAFDVLGDEAARREYDRAPAAPSEDEIRRRLNEEYAAAVALVLTRLTRAVRALEPGAGWTEAARRDPWDLVLEAAGERRVFIKVFADLHPGDLVSTIEVAEATRSARDAGGRADAYLLVAGLLLDPGRLFTIAEDFNRRAWSERPSGPRAFVGYSDLDGHFPVLPGVVDPGPDLAQISVGADRDPTWDFSALEPEPARAPDPEPEPAPESPAPPCLEPVAEPAPPSRPEPAPEPESEDEIRILVVDDERLPFQVVRRALRADPFDLDHATDWASFRRLLEEYDYAAVVLDLHLPMITGDKLALFLASNDEIIPKPRVVVYSSQDEATLRRVAARIGAHSYLAKGCPDERLRAAVRAAAKSYTRDVLLRGPW